MNILSVQQVRAWDAFTIAQEPISSLNLMERASSKVVEWLLGKNFTTPLYAIFCGPGNNGGDGLAVARLLKEAGLPVAVYMLDALKKSTDCLANLKRLQSISLPVNLITSSGDFPSLPPGVIIIEALFGTGLNRPLEGLAALLVDHINSLQNEVISIDMPAGLLADELTPGDHVIKAAYTLSFQSPRLALFLPENEIYAGKWEVLNIGLHPAFEVDAHMQWVLPDSPWLQLNQYRKHAHKGLLGHALISAGSKEKMGAAVMAAKACLTTGSGLLTMAVPEDCYSIIQTVTPEAMCRPQGTVNEFFLQHAKINAVAIGPGWEESEAFQELLEEMIVKVKCPLLIDATALYHLSANLSLLSLRPKGSETILTPHPGEFARLFSPSANSFERMQKAIEKAKEYNVFIVLKGAYTQVVTPGGMSYFNSTGNPGMAKGGSGDALTGMITSLLAQRYPATLACVLGVYAHGLAGDIAAAQLSQQGMTAMSIVRCLPQAWKTLQHK